MCAANGEVRDGNTCDRQWKIYLVVRPYKLSVAFEPRTLIMEHDLVPRQTQLLKSNSYVASTGCKNSVTWYKEKAGHVLIDPESRTNAVLAVVGKVLESRLDCDGHGNFRKRV